MQQTWHSYCVGPLRKSCQNLAQEYDSFLLDLDGVVYVGHDAVPGVIHALNQAHELFGPALTAVTNNAARSSAVVAAHLQELGLNVAPADVVTSAQAGAAELAKALPSGARVFVLGSRDLMSEVAEVGLVPSQEFGPQYDALIQGYWPDMPWRMLGQAAGILTTTKCFWVATNMDLTIPTQWGTSPGNGTMVNALSIATGRKPDVVAGKPETPLMQASIDRTGSTHPLVVGDRLDTDILGAHRVGIDSILVFSGVTTIAELLRADDSMRPTFLGWTAADVLQPQHAVEVAGDTTKAGNWTYSAGELSGSGDSLDAIRSVAVATWTGHSTPDQGIQALSRIGLDVNATQLAHEQ